MILHATRRAAKAIGARPFREGEPAGTSRLGNWYVNLIEWDGPSFFLFTSERSLLSVVVPADQKDLLQEFVRRVMNLLSMIGVPDESIHRELEHFRDLAIATTRSRSVLGSMNDLALGVIVRMEQGPHPVSLSDLELELSKIPMSAIGTRGQLEYPRTVGLALMGVRRDWLM
ncbi:MAG: hypothetical protein ABR517_00600 [Thermoanaerobaculia bacterium]